MVDWQGFGDSGEHATEQNSVICDAHNHGNLEKISETLTLLTLIEGSSSLFSLMRLHFQLSRLKIPYTCWLLIR